jgi:hypothetical protein
MINDIIGVSACIVGGLRRPNKNLPRCDGGHIEVGEGEQLKWLASRGTMGRARAAA